MSALGLGVRVKNKKSADNDVHPIASRSRASKTKDVDEQTTTTTTDRANNGSRKKRAPDIVWSVRVSCMNSLKYFYVQKSTDYEYLRTTVGPALEAAPAAADGGADSSRPPKAGELTAARCADGSWRRARVKCKNNGNASELSVRFIDYAADQLDTVTEYKALPRDLAVDALPPMAHRCYFKNLPKDAETEPGDPNVTRVLKRYFGETHFVATLHNHNEPYAVTLRSAADGKDAIATINELIWEGVAPAADGGPTSDPIAVAYRSTVDAIGERCRRRGRGVRVVRFGPVASTEHFYVETARGNRVARNVRKHIDATVNWCPASQPAVGQTLIARCDDDGRLYRARLAWSLPRRASDHHGDRRPPRFRCFLIDRGAFADCCEFYHADSEYLRTAPPAKIHCSLDAARLYAGPVWRCVARSFADEMAAASRRGATVKVLLELRKAGSPCAVDLRVDGLLISDVIKPVPVHVLDVHRTFATNRQFTVRLSCPASRKLCDTLKSTGKFRPAEDPQQLNMYVAELGNGRFRRVKFVGESSARSSAAANTTVYKTIGVDEPFQQRYSVDRLYELPKCVANVQTTNAYCTLASAAGGWPDGSSRCSADKFSGLCDKGNATFHMVVVENDHMNGHLVRLFLKSKDVSTMIDDGK